MVSIVISYRAFTATAELQRQQAKDQFDMTAAKLVVNNTDPELAHSKAQLLQELFPHHFRRIGLRILGRNAIVSLRSTTEWFCCIVLRRLSGTMRGLKYFSLEDTAI
jgi:hypothetical protein